MTKFKQNFRMFVPNFTIFTKIHNLYQIWQILPNFAILLDFTILTKVHIFDKISYQFHTTKSANFWNFWAIRREGVLPNPVDMINPKFAKSILSKILDKNARFMSSLLSEKMLHPYHTRFWGGNARYIHIIHALGNC